MEELLAAKKIRAILPGSDEQNKTLIEKISERQTEELIIAVCGSLGSGPSTVAEKIKGCLTSYGYNTQYLKISDLIKKYASLVEKEIDGTQKKADEISLLQDTGNALREKYGNDILAQMVISEISIKRFEQSSIDVGEGGEDPKRESRRFATIIDSLKHPAEVKLLRSVYGNMFYLLGVLCPEQLRKERLKDKGLSPEEAVRLMERDKSEKEGFGQKLLNTIQDADFFIRNTVVNVNYLEPCIERYIKLILGTLNITPTIHEYAMCCAESASLRSGCLSRQVGAAIINTNKELIATGCNDVPKYEGGLYSTEDGSGDGRCMTKYGNKCKNQEYREEIIGELKDIIKSYDLDSLIHEKLSEEISKNEKLNNLLEFSRSVHAEMDAIISIARRGGVSLKDATLYCTTFPCHNCARHIIAAGITQVYYIEPYEKSLALDLHSDAIVFEPSSTGTNGKKVIFSPFEGVAPKQYKNLFRCADRKIDGKLIDRDLQKSKPGVPQLLDTYLDYETKVVENLKELEIVE